MLVPSQMMKACAMCAEQSTLRPMQITRKMQTKASMDWKRLKNFFKLVNVQKVQYNKKITKINVPDSRSKGRQ